LEFLSGVPHETLRKERELDLQIMLGQALVATKGYGADEPAETYARARDLCQQLNRPSQLGQVLWGQWVFRHVRAELERAERHFWAHWPIIGRVPVDTFPRMASARINNEFWMGWKRP
jgi:predicted ATPase